MEADLNPRDWVKGSDCVNMNPYSDVKVVQYENMCQFMHSCFYSNHPTRNESSRMCLSCVEESKSASHDD
eukprot:11969061-Prorocentrum_lima.AAC.1